MIGSAQITIAVGLVVVSFIIGFYTCIQFEKARRTNQLQQILEQKEQVEKDKVEAEQLLAEALEDNRNNTKVIVKRVNHEVEKIAYRDCVLPIDGLQLVNSKANSYTTQ